MFSLKNLETRIRFVAVVLFYRLSLDVVYALYISRHYEHLGFTYDPKQAWLIAYSYFLVIVTSSFVRLEGLPSCFIVGFLYLVTYVPALSIMALGNYPLMPVFWLTAAYMFLFLLSHQKIDLDIGPRVDRKSRLFKISIPILFVANLVLIMQHFSFEMPSLEDALDVFAYRRRAEYFEYLRYTGSFVSYVLTWQANVINPIVLFVAIMRRSVLLFVISIACQILLFSITGERSHLFAILVMAWLALGMGRYRDRLVQYSVVSFIALIASVMTADFLIGGEIPYLTATITQRIFHTPALLYFHYYEYFSDNPVTYLSQSVFFNLISKYPYGYSIPDLIGYSYFTDEGASANAHVFADAFSNFGLAGLFIFGVLLWMAVNLVDIAARNKNKHYVYALMAMPLFRLTNTGLLTTMITFGMLLAIALMFLLPVEETERHQGG